MQKIVGRHARLVVGVVLLVGLGVAVMGQYGLIRPPTAPAWRDFFVSDAIKRQEIAEARQLLDARAEIEQALIEAATEFGEQLAQYAATDQPQQVTQVGVEAVRRLLPPGFTLERLDPLETRTPHRWLHLVNIVIEGRATDSKNMMRALFTLADPVTGRHWQTLTLEADPRAREIQVHGVLVVPVLTPTLDAT